MATHKPAGDTDLSFNWSQTRRAFPAVVCPDPAAVASKTKQSSAHHAASSLVSLAPPTSLHLSVLTSIIVPHVPLNWSNQSLSRAQTHKQPEFTQEAVQRKTAQTVI